MEAIEGQSRKIESLYGKGSAPTIRLSFSYKDRLRLLPVSPYTIGFFLLGLNAFFLMILLTAYEVLYTPLFLTVAMPFFFILLTAWRFVDAKGKMQAVFDKAKEEIRSYNPKIHSYNPEPPRYGWKKFLFESQQGFWPFSTRGLWPIRWISFADVNGIKVVQTASQSKLLRILGESGSAYEVRLCLAKRDVPDYVVSRDADEHRAYKVAERIAQFLNLQISNGAEGADENAGMR